MGHLIPAGTGFPALREIKLVELGEQVGDPLNPKRRNRSPRSAKNDHGVEIGPHAVRPPSFTDAIATKTGDAGETSLMYGRRVPKTDPRVDAYGCVDELNSALGVVRATTGAAHRGTSSLHPKRARHRDGRTGDGARGPRALRKGRLHPHDSRNRRSPNQRNRRTQEDKTLYGKGWASPATPRSVPPLTRAYHLPPRRTPGRGARRH